MINISKLYCGHSNDSDALRYGEGQSAPSSAQERRPVVVWNVTKSCNLRCIHCYTSSEAKRYAGELTTEEGRRLLEDLSDFKIPALLLSGGEPLTRGDLFELASHAKELGLRCTLSTNGTLMTEDVALQIKKAGFVYVGISLDGIGTTNDHFRGREGAFRAAVRGFRNCLAVGQKVGLRMTLTHHTIRDLDRIFDFIEEEGIHRACFYHLVYSGRGGALSSWDLKPEESRQAMEVILKRTKAFSENGFPREILTVDNHVDGVYLYLKLLQEDPERAEKVRKLLEWNGGGLYSSGIGIADIDFQGNVHPDQFWMHYTLGNIRERKFSEIWQDDRDPLLYGLRHRAYFLKGRCRFCKFFKMCGGSFRVRADLLYKDPWAPDPACYLTDEEIGLGPKEKVLLGERGET